MRTLVLAIALVCIMGPHVQADPIPAGTVYWGAPKLHDDRVYDAEQCDGRQPKDARTRIAACTRVISWRRSIGRVPAPPLGTLLPDRPASGDGVLVAALWNRGSLLQGTGDLDGALVDFNEVIRSDPAFGPAYSGRAVVYAGKGDWDRALADFNDSVRLRPDNAEALLGRAFVYLKTKQFAEANADFDKAVAMHPQDADVLNGRCWMRALAGEQLEAALQDCTQAIALASQRKPHWMLDSRGWVFLRMSNFPAAIADFDAAIKLRPNLPSSLYGRGIAKLRSGDTAGGNADIASAKAHEPTIGEYYARYGITP